MAYIINVGLIEVKCVWIFEYFTPTIKFAGDGKLHLLVCSPIYDLPYCLQPFVQSFV